MGLVYIDGVVKHGGKSVRVRLLVGSGVPPEGARPGAAGGHRLVGIYPQAAAPRAGRRAPAG